MFYVTQFLVQRRLGEVDFAWQNYVSFLCWRCSDSQPMAVASAQFTFPDSSQHQCRLALREPDDCAFPWQLSTSVSPTLRRSRGLWEPTGALPLPLSGRVEWCHLWRATRTLLPAQCRNGATCVSGASNYTCTCPQGFVGDMCADVIGESTGHLLSFVRERGEGGISRPVFSPLNTK